MRRNADVFGLDVDDLRAMKVTRHYKTAGLEQITFGQSYEGIPAIDSFLRGNLTRAAGWSTCRARRSDDLSVPSVEPELDASAAYRAALEAVDGSGRLADGDAQLVIYDNGGPQLGWRLRVPVDSTHVYDVVVDATTRRRRPRAQLRARVANDATIYRNYPDAAVGGTAETVYIDPVPQRGRDHPQRSLRAHGRRLRRRRSLDPRQRDRRHRDPAGRRRGTGRSR